MRRAAVRVRLRCGGQVVGAQTARQRHQTRGGSVPPRLLRRFRGRRVFDAADRGRCRRRGRPGTAATAPPAPAPAATTTRDGRRPPTASQLDGIRRRPAVVQAQLVVHRPRRFRLHLHRRRRPRPVEIADRGRAPQIAARVLVALPTAPPALVARVVRRCRLLVVAVAGLRRRGVAVGHGAHESRGHRAPSVDRMLPERLPRDRS